MWFFTAGRYENSSTPNTTVQTNIAYTSQVTNKRAELKGTGTVAPSPTTHEVTFGLGRELGTKGFAKATYTWRKTYDFVEDFITLANGRTTVNRNGTNFGTFNNVVYSNTDAKREYQGVVLQSSCRPRNMLIGGSYTLQIKNEGNYAGEGTNQPGAVSLTKRRIG